ncbi:Alpha,alpha-trehalose-phosphate synthase (UDP-forming) [Georgfuchsia toluolica]|uniref:Alpha,alpha-trehalose-phosphate synthase (UDP-forming) n=1 Tax=Georgfuchsia toluolica TaxID=424218 RepID=A0A916N3P4_9PROT|nr:trehalose-6-phosphate synthase [Georgfuchsia toluolica]CAG4885296.1 Alpha,alpha-trehalose-phosphate synthase (UDP-forming) [Georgfuchsia toluolica]
MRLTLRFVIPLLIVIGAIAYAVVPLVDRLTLRWAVRDLDMRASLIAKTIQEPLLEQTEPVTPRKMLGMFKRVSEDERMYALGYCAAPAEKMVSTSLMPEDIRCDTLTPYGLIGGSVLRGKHGSLHVAVRPMDTADNPEGKLVLIHDMSFIERRSEETRDYLFYFFAGLAFVVSLLTVVIAQLSWRGWMQGIRSLMRGEGLLRQPGVSIKVPQKVPELRPIARDLQRLVEDLEAEHRARDESQISWTAESLRTILHGELRGEDVIVVSNREPYIHQHSGDKIEVQRPASGLVTALEPIMRACSGIWIAHGGGTADRDTVDRNDRVAVPPGNPAYQLRRIWLSEEQVNGYYYGFANEGLWPLCHIAHVRPTFRSGDWAHYVAVNQKFADAVVKEAKTKDPIVLVQDYHFALLPRMLREALPDATIITFWHIPWPNPESFAICPWREEIVLGLLGSSIVGFHTQIHCNNFVDTVDRFIEARVDREALGVTLGGKKTLVRRYPISIDWPPEKELLAKPVEQCRAEIRQKNHLPANHAIGIGIDRLDYTKGIIERFRAVERLFELNPEWIGRFTFVQIAAPSRSSIFEYKSHETLVIETAAQINQRFGGRGAPPIILKIEHHEPWQVYEYYRAAELCFVSSLHDGMNLVAKEFIAARDDQRGILVLSQFTGAARELPEALIVNPYDADQCAAALQLALVMPLTEQRDRMRLMRGLVSEFNVYRWAGRMLLDAASMRRRLHLVEKSEPLKTQRERKSQS